MRQQSLLFNQSFYVSDFVRISTADLTLRKRYKQTFTYKVFEIYDIPKTNPPTYILLDASQELVKGKFYE